MNLNADEATSEEQPRALKQKDRYLLEKARIIEQIGDLETIRMKLGLSQRKLCQLLLVDPSAWTRWMKTDAPPHIYQALKWLIELRSHNPDAMLSQSLDTRIDLVQAHAKSEYDELQIQIGILTDKLALMSELQGANRKTVRRKRKLKKTPARRKAKKKLRKKAKKRIGKGRRK